MSKVAETIMDAARDALDKDGDGNISVMEAATAVKWIAQGLLAWRKLRRGEASGLNLMGDLYTKVMVSAVKTVKDAGGIAEDDQ